MRILRNLVQVILTSLSLCISVASAQTPCDSIDIVDPIENPQNIDQTQDNTLPSESDIFISDKLIIPVDPYIPPVPVEPPIPLDPIIPSGDKLVIDIDPTDPGIPTNNNKYTLGSVSGTLTVNGLGAAEFAVPIEAPVAGPLIPNLSLVYNSQNATNGLAGYGITLSGLSSITRGEKSIFNNNGSIAGITYTNTDNLFLDGKRLILESGTHCLEGAVYCIEGDPFTKITAHTQNTLGIVDTWFEIKTPDGLTFQYGKTSDSKLIFNNASGNRRIASWHINRTEDVKGNYMTVKYKQVDYYLYPESVLYGMNSIKDRGLKNKIEINYEDIGATPNYFFLEDKKGSINKRIASITSSSNDEVFRKYILSYDVTSDKSMFPYARLISIQEKNGYGDSLTPTKISWSSLTDGSIAVARIKDPTLNINDMIILDDSKKAYMAADVTGDGISDIIVIATGKKRYTQNTPYIHL